MQRWSRVRCTRGVNYLPTLMRQGTHVCGGIFHYCSIGDHGSGPTWACGGRPASRRVPPGLACDPVFVEAASRGPTQWARSLARSRAGHCTASRPRRAQALGTLASPGPEVFRATGGGSVVVGVPGVVDRAGDRKLLVDLSCRQTWHRRRRPLFAVGVLGEYKSCLSKRVVAYCPVAVIVARFGVQKGDGEGRCISRMHGGRRHPRARRRGMCVGRPCRGNG